MQKDSINGSGNITLEDLAGMVARGFSSMEERFDLRMGCLETRMGGLETRMDGFEMRIDNLETKMDKGFREVHERLDRVEIQQGGGVFKKKFSW